MARAADTLTGLDDQARRAWDAVDDTAPTQLALLRALDALIAATPPDGVLRSAMQQQRDARVQALGERHRRRVREAITAHELKGPAQQEPLIEALEQALAFLVVVHGESGEVRTLRLQLQDAKNGHGGMPRPFFARFLEIQKR